VKDSAIYWLSPIYHFWHFLCDFCNFCVHFLHFLYLLGACFCTFYVFNKEDFLCAFFFLCFFIFFCTFLHFLLPPIVEVDISDIAIISEITNMMKTIILAINNTPQKTYRIAQYTDFWNQFHSRV
jgi:hypothetical protein